MSNIEKIAIGFSLALIVIMASGLYNIVNAGERLAPWPEDVYCAPKHAHQRLVTNSNGYVTGIKRFYVCNNGKSYQWLFKLENP